MALPDILPTNPISDGLIISLSTGRGRLNPDQGSGWNHLNPIQVAGKPFPSREKSFADFLQGYHLLIAENLLLQVPL